MRRFCIAGNWKMNKTPEEAAAFGARFKDRLADVAEAIDVVLAAPALALPALRQSLLDSRVDLGAQDLFWVDQGAFTGEVSGPMLRALGVKYVIIGHSERRGRFGKLEIDPDHVGYFAETDDTVALKVAAAERNSLIPIVCVGETLAEREAGKTDDLIQAQVRTALESAERPEQAVVAYEPVWAIGTGKTCDTDEAQRVCAMIRQSVADLHGDRVAQSVRIQYGGSVKPENAVDLFAQPDIDGALVGGASLEVDSFVKILQSV